MNAVRTQLRALYAVSPAERTERIETGLIRAQESLQRLRPDEDGAPERIEQLCGLLHALEREARLLAS